MNAIHAQVKNCSTTKLLLTKVFMFFINNYLQINNFEYFTEGVLEFVNQIQTQCPLLEYLPNHYCPAFVSNADKLGRSETRALQRRRVSWPWRGPIISLIVSRLTSKVSRLNIIQEILLLRHSRRKLFSFSHKTCFPPFNIRIPTSRWVWLSVPI